MKFGPPTNKKVTGRSGPAGPVVQKHATMASDTDRKLKKVISDVV